jgi:hypothetical protein
VKVGGVAAAVVGDRPSLLLERRRGGSLSYRSWNPSAPYYTNSNTMKLDLYWGVIEYCKRVSRLTRKEK